MSSPLTVEQRHAALEFARRVDRLTSERARTPDEAELWDIIGDCAAFGSMVICPACHGSGWGPPAQAGTALRHALCKPCLGCGAVTSEERT